MKHTLRVFIRVALGIVGSLIGISILLIIAFFQWLPGCADTVYQTLYSPDRMHKVVLYARNCGATTGFGTHISLAKADEDIDNGFKILTADTDHGRAESHPIHAELIDIRIKWLDNHALELSYDKNTRLFAEKESVGGIKIIHRKR